MGARGARGCHAGGAGQEVEHGGTVQVAVARMVHVTYWVPAGRAMDATAGTLRVGAVDATAGGPSFLLKNATGAPPPFTLLTEEVGWEGVGRGGV